MTTIGDKIISEIGLQRMIAIHHADGTPVPPPLIFVWNENAGDQLSALVDDYIRNHPTGISSEDIQQAMD